MYIFEIIKSFLSGRSSNVVAIGKTSEAHEVNSGNLLAPTPFLLYMNNLSTNILRSFVNIYANDSIPYVCTSRNIDTQKLTADHTYLSAYRENWLVTFNTTIAKLVSLLMNRLWISPVMIDGFTRNEAPCFEHQLGFVFTPDRYRCLRSYHIETLVLLRSAKLSKVEHDQYLDGWSLEDAMFFKLGCTSGVINNLSPFWNWWPEFQFPLCSIYSM